MQDMEIVELYWNRDEAAIERTQEKYGRYLVKIAYNILTDMEDSKESVNDTYYSAWKSMPPHKPQVLSTYLGKLTRQISIDVFRKKNSKKRKHSQYALSLSELEECISGSETPHQMMELGLLAQAIGAYLSSISKEARILFVCRYFYMDSLSEIAQYTGNSESKVKSSLYRTRKNLKSYLEMEGFVI